jgi:predicted DNA-binding ribbon-helix-helix protein
MTVKRSISIRGHRTSVSLEAPFWEALTSMAAVRGTSVAALVAEVDAERGPTNLSSALRLAVLAHYRGPPSSTRVADDATVR